MLLTCAVHVVGVFRVFRWSEVTSPEPFLTDDYAFHFSSVELYRRFRSEQGQVWGYDPFFCAGYPQGAVSDLSSKLWERVTYVLARWMPGPLAFKAFTVGVVLAIPALLWVAAWGFGLAGAARAGLVGIGTLYFWASLLRQMVQNGVLGFVLGLYGALATVGLLWRWLTAPTAGGAALLGGAGALLMAAHPTAPLLAGIPTGGLLAAWWVGRAGTRPYAARLAILAGLVVVVAAANWPWMEAYWRFREFHQPVAPHASSPDPWTILKDYAPWGPFYGTLFPSAAHKWIRLGLLAAGAAGLWRFRREGWARGVAAASLATLGLTYWGYLTPLTAAAQPLRYRHLLDLMLAIPTSAWIVEKRWRLLLALVAALGLAVSAAQHELRSPQYYVKAGPTERLTAVVDWVKAQPADGRILLEDSDDESGHQYDFTHVPALLPLWTGRAFIGGPYPYMPDRHHFPEFTAGVLSGTPISRYDGPAIRAYCRRYNIIRVLCFSPEARAVCDRDRRLFRPLGRIGERFFTYAVNRPASFVLEGTAGRVTADLNRITVERPSGEAVTLSFHWIKTLTVKDGVAAPATASPSSASPTLEPVRIGQDPIPFIRLTPPRPSGGFRRPDAGPAWPAVVEIVNGGFR